VTLLAGETQQIETPGTPGYSLASPEFFHLLQRIEQTENTLRQEIKLEISALRGEMRQEIGALRQEIGALRQEIKQDLAGVRTLIWATLALVTGALGLAATVIMR